MTEETPEKSVHFHPETETMTFSEPLQAAADNHEGDEPPAQQQQQEEDTSAASPEPEKRSWRPGLEHAHEHIDLATGRVLQRRQSIRQLSSVHAAGTKWSKFKSRIGLMNDEEQDEQDAPKTSKHNVYRIKSTITDDSFNKTQIVVDPKDEMTSLLSDYLRYTFRASFFEIFLLSYLFFVILILLFALLIYWVGRYQPQCINAGGEADFVEAGTNYMDAIQLSWTTLSTVGYGIISPQVIPEAPYFTRCVGLNILMAFESFVGVLFGGVTGAIIFGKVARIQSVAQVLFSHPICVRYGTGVMQVAGKDGDDGAKGDDDDDDEDDDEAKLDLPCPILEFRLVNELSNYKGGEILDASVNVVATTLAEKDESSSSRDWASKSSAGIMEKMGKAAVKATTGVAKVSGKAAVMSGKAAMKAGATATKVTSKVVKTGGAGLMGASKRAGQATGSIVQRLNQSIVSAGRSSDFLSSPLSSHSIPEDNETVDSVTPPVISDAQLEKEIEKEVEHRLAEKIREEEQKLGIITALEAQQNNVVVDEGDSKIAPLRIFHKLEIETDSHPFFRRVWNIRHVLDAKSPLLSAKARKMIEQNNGYWPEELNDHAEVRKHLHFRELIVNFSGTANVSGSSVYAQKVYDFADVNIGYSFAQVLGLSQDGKLMVDKELINDIREQNGGGAEPFTDINVEVSAVEFAAQLADQVTEGVEAMHRGAMGAANQVAEGMKEVHNKMAEGLKGPIQNLSHSIPKTTTEEAVESSDLVDVEAGGDDPKAAA